jgi:hypothetical protein
MQSIELFSFIYRNVTHGIVLFRTQMIHLKIKCMNYAVWRTCNFVACKLSVWSTKNWAPHLLRPAMVPRQSVILRLEKDKTMYMWHNIMCQHIFLKQKYWNFISAFKTFDISFLVIWLQRGGPIWNNWSNWIKASPACNDSDPVILWNIFDTRSSFL